MMRYPAHHLTDSLPAHMNPVAPQPVTTLTPISPTDLAGLACIENLMQFYNYELSQWYEIEFASNGLYPIRSKASYWAQAGVMPWLIHVDGQLAGFAVVDAEVIDSASQYNLGYFFIARRYRGRGVGKAAFEQLLARFAGAWEVYYLVKNQVAAGFWASILPRAGVQQLSSANMLIHEQESLIYRFKTE